MKLISAATPVYIVGPFLMDTAQGTPALNWSTIELIVFALDSQGNQGKEVVIVEHPLSQGFSELAGFEILVHVISYFLSKHISPELIQNDLFHAFLHNGPDVSLCNESCS